MISELSLAQHRLRRANAELFFERPDDAEALFALRDKAIVKRLSRKDTIEYRAGVFVKSIVGEPAAGRECRELKIKIEKAEATQPNTAGGVLVPEDLANTIISLLEVFGVARAHAGVWPMTRDVLTVPRSTSSAWSVSWSTENAAAKFSDAALDNTTLTARKLSAYAKISNELFEDATEALGMFLLLGMAQAFAKVEDQAAFGGDGTSTYAGIEGVSFLLNDGNHTAGKVTAASGHTGFATLDATDLGNAIAALPARAMANAKIYISVGGYGAALVRLASIGGGLVATIVDGKLEANWHGLPICFTQVLPSGTGSLASQMLLAVGDLSQAISFGARRDLAIQTFPETYADIDQTMIRATERIDIVAADLGDNSAAGALVGLYAAAS